MNMAEVFKPRENMVFDTHYKRWTCRDEDGNYICDGGPSTIYSDGTWVFWISGIRLHRIDGPATSYGDWYILGKCVTEEIHAFAEENDIDLYNLTDEDKVLMALKFGY